MRIAAAALMVLAVPIAAAARPPMASSAATAKAARTVPLRIASPGKTHRFQVEVAATPEAQERGLMFRQTMAADHGMIFPMAPPRPASFWMKNTYLPLDLVFIGPDRRIVRIAADAVPQSLDLIECPEPVSAVLELNGGTARKLGLSAGDKVAW